MGQRFGGYPFIEHHISAPAIHVIVLSAKLHKRQKEPYSNAHCEAVNCLLHKYATDDVIAQGMQI